MGSSKTAASQAQGCPAVRLAPRPRLTKRPNVEIRYSTTGRLVTTTAMEGAAAHPAAVYGGAYVGRGPYYAGGAGGSLHSLVTGFHDMLRSHCAELTPGFATVAAAIDSNATATTAARRRTNHLMETRKGKFPASGGF